MLVYCHTCLSNLNISSINLNEQKYTATMVMVSFSMMTHSSNTKSGKCPYSQVHLYSKAGPDSWDVSFFIDCKLLHLLSPPVDKRSWGNVKECYITMSLKAFENLLSSEWSQGLLLCHCIIGRTMIWSSKNIVWGASLFSLTGYFFMMMKTPMVCWIV